MSEATPSHAGGEEWREMDKTTDVYDPGESADTIKAARMRIRELRMREVEIRLLDHAGRPVAQAPVEIVQTRNAFSFGDQLWELDAMIRDGEEETGRAQAWKRRFAEVFNAANNLCYWTERDRHDASKTEGRQGEWRLESFAKTVDWTLSAGMTAKGHPLFWSIPKAVPEWVKRYDNATQMKFAEVRVRNIVARFRGRVKIWDAVNEAMWEPAFKNLGRREWPHIEAIADIADYIQQVLQWCREEDPDAIYLVNDYGMDAGANSPPLVGNNGSCVSAASQRKRFLALVRELQDRGAPPDAIGLQSHTGWLRHEEQWAIYDEFASSGLPVHITEFWASTKDLEKTGRFSARQIEGLQAEYVANCLTCAFGHPAVGAFFFWGFMGTAIDWMKRSSHDPKPIFERVKKLIREEWMTHENMTTNADGVVKLRGFLGDYALRYPLKSGLLTGQSFSIDRRASMPLTLVIGHQPKGI